MEPDVPRCAASLCRRRRRRVPRCASCRWRKRLRALYQPSGCAALLVAAFPPHGGSLRARRCCLAGRRCGPPGGTGWPVIFTTGGVEHTLRARADRIDVLHNARPVRLIDYKTGSVPSINQVEVGLSPQLTLEAAMLTRLEFRRRPAGRGNDLVYIRISGGTPPVKVIFLSDQKTPLRHQDRLCPAFRRPQGFARPLSGRRHRAMSRAPSCSRMMTFRTMTISRVMPNGRGAAHERHARATLPLPIPPVPSG